MPRVSRSRAVSVPSRAPASQNAGKARSSQAPRGVSRHGDSFERPGFSRFGIDTNSGTMPTSAVKQHGAKFVARYLSDDGSPNDPPLTPEEAKRWSKAGVPLVAVWETGREDHVLAGNSVGAAFTNGAADAQKAAAAIAAAGGKGKPIYFTVDFNVTQKSWSTKVTDPTTGKTTTQGALIRAYFAGIRSVLPKNQVGAYGTETTLKHLFDHKTIGYGWQQTFGRKGKNIDPRAQLQQYGIYPSQDGWGVSQAGGLDKDRAVAKNFGQWESTLVKPKG